MLFEVEIAACRDTAFEGSRYDVAPRLMHANSEPAWFFGGGVRLEYSRRPGGNSFDFARVGDKLVLLAGYARSMGHDEYLSPRDVLAEVGRGSQRFGGQYVICIIDWMTRSVTILTTLSRLIPVYWSFDSGILRISNRQTALRGSVDYSDLDLEAWQPFFGHGYFPHERSIYRGVSVAPADAKLAWNVGDLPVNPNPKVSTLSDIGARIGGEAPTEETFDLIADALRRAFVPIVPDLPTRIGLSGGRDSRLIAACLHSAGVDFGTYTRAGQRDIATDSEVVVARQVAELLGVKHSATADSMEGRAAGTTVSDFITRAAAVGRNTDLSVFAHETLNSEPTKFSVSEISYNGGGGELLRQAFGGTSWRSDEAAIRQIRAHARGTKWGVPDAWYESWIEDWLHENSHLSPGGLLNKFSLFYRTGRWGSGVYGAQYGKVNQRPFYDNELLSLVLPIGSEWTASDVVYYEVLARLAPTLLTVPFSGTRRWGLENATSLSYQALARTLPEPIGTSSLRGHAKLGWRQKMYGPLGRDLLSIVENVTVELGLLSKEAHQILAAAVTRLRSGERSGALTKRVWASASAGVYGAMASGQWGVYESLERQS